MSRFVNINVSSDVQITPRVRQVCTMFDCPPDKKSLRTWSGEVPLDTRPWQVGLIVGPSGAGKSTIARDLFGSFYEPVWGSRSVIDEVAPEMSVEDVSAAFSSVGFSTIPAWLRPYHVLSTGEKFRVDLARALLERGPLVCVDEFTSVVDRQVAQIGSHAVQKYVRKRPGLQFVAVGCHYDVIDWLQPDWILEPATMSFTWRSVQPRPQVECVIKRAARGLWPLFAPYHYMSADLSRSARCYALYVADKPVCFTGIGVLPVSRGARAGSAIARVSRVVTLPDWQGLGLAFALLETLGAAYAAIGRVFRNYPAHPAFVRSHQRSSAWRQTAKLGTMKQRDSKGATGDRHCAVFEYCGPTMSDTKKARALLGVA